MWLYIKPQQLKFFHFLGIFVSWLTSHSISFPAKKTISRDSERDEMVMLSKIRNKVFLLLVLLMRVLYLHRILGLIGFGIHVSNINIKHVISSRRSEAMYKDIPTVIIGSTECCRGSRGSRSQSSHGSALVQGWIRVFSRTALGIAFWQARTRPWPREQARPC